jgi:hypothetical protein
MYAILYLKTGEYVSSVIRLTDLSSRLVRAKFNTKEECKEVINTIGRLVCINPVTNIVYPPDTLVVMRCKIPIEANEPYGWLFFTDRHLLEVVEVD